MPSTAMTARSTRRDRQAAHVVRFEQRQPHAPAKTRAVTIRYALIGRTGRGAKQPGRRDRSSENRIESAPYVPSETSAM